MKDRKASSAAPCDPSLLRAARASLGWSLLEAGRLSRVSVASVVAAERGGLRPASASALDALRLTYEEAGVCFFADDARGLGLRILPR